VSEIKIGIAIPTAGMVHINFAAALVGMVAKFAAGGVPTVPEAKITIALHVLQSSTGSRTGRNWRGRRLRMAKRICCFSMTT